MTKQHFIALAAEIRLILDNESRYLAACAVANVAIRFNASFSRTRFLSACGVTSDSLYR